MRSGHYSIPYVVATLSYASVRVTLQSSTNWINKQSDEADKYKAGNLTFRRSPEKYFQLCSMSLTASLRNRELETAVGTNNVKTSVDENVIALIISALNENSLHKIHDCTATRAAWNKLHTRYSAETTTNELRLLQTLFNLRNEEDKEMKNHVSYLESQLSRLLVVGTTLEEPLQVFLLMSSLLNVVEYQSITSSINDLPEHGTIWAYLTALLIEKSERVVQQKVNKPRNVSKTVSVVAASKSNSMKTDSFPPLAYTRIGCHLLKFWQIKPRDQIL